MSASTPHICRNCNHENNSPFQFCPNCGQKNTDGKITFGELWTEFQDAVFNIDSRTWRTFKAMFVPGKLTLEYFAGKHRHYVHPLRLLLVTIVLVALALSFQNFQSYTNHFFVIKDRILENYEQRRAYGMLMEAVDSTKTIFPTPQSERVADTIVHIFRDSLYNLLEENGDRHGDSVNLNRYATLSKTYTLELVSKQDFLTMDEEELVEVYKKEASWWERLVFKQKVRYINDESRLAKAVLGNITWAILLMMPFLAMVLYFLFNRKTSFYIEHLIFAFHLHAFAFLLIAVMIAGINVFPIWIFMAAFLAIAIYVYVSMYRVYQQTKLQTFFKFILLNIFYGVLFFMFLFGTFMTTFFLL